MPQFEYETEPLDESEKVLGVFYGGRGQVGQKYVVTNRRLLMGPLDTGVALEIDKYLLDKVSAGQGAFLGNVLAKYAPMKSKTVWLTHVDSVEPTNDARLLKAPGLRIATDTQEILNLGIVATPTSMNRDPRNNGARDNMVQLIRSAAQEAAAAGPTPV